MKKLTKYEIALALKNKSVLIWGARMTGLGAIRYLSANSVNVIGFIDSDPAFKNKKVQGIPVYSPEVFQDLTIKHSSKDISIVIAVSLKESEIIKQYGGIFKNYSFYSFQNDNEPSYTIDILGTCNLKCASCPHSIEDHIVPKGSMSFDSFKNVFDKIMVESPSTTHISLYSWGEPLLHPHLDKIIDYAHEKNIAVALSSNLSINFKGRLENIVKSNPDYLKISLSGYYQNTYANTHQGGDIELVKSNMREIRKLMDRFNVNFLVDINYHLYIDNAGKNLNLMTKLADELGFIISSTYALVMPLERVINYVNGNPDQATIDLEKNMLVTIAEGIEASSKTKLPKGECPFRENQININADLTVPVCCTVFERNNLVSNNFLESSFEEINMNKTKVKLCDECMNNNLPEYNMGFNKKLWKQIAESKKIKD
jgi:MoaA/NifB/PqqE/SkfB family radical SAM enzyme